MSHGVKKRVITISVLSAVLVALILVYIFVILPLLKPEEEKKYVPQIIEGEELYINNMICMYPVIDEEDVTYLEITNEHGTYAFHKHYSAGMDVEEMRFVGYEGLQPDQSMYSLLKAYVKTPMSYQSNVEEFAPMRNQTEKQMAQYGVTKDTCTASYTIKYMDGDEEKQHTVYIGNKTFSNDVTYYVALEGRNSVYRFPQEGVETCMLASMTDYLMPLVYGKYSTVSVAMVNIVRFRIAETIPENLGTDKEYIRSLVEIVKTGQNDLGTANIYDLLYKSRGTGEIARTSASVETLSTAFTAFYTYFKGDKVMCVNPTEEQLKEYGLDKDSPQYFVDVHFSEKEGDTYTMQISQKIDGYYYTLSEIYGEEYPMLVRVPEKTLQFLGNDDKTIFSWAGTDVTSLFYEYLVQNPQDEDSSDVAGMNQIRIVAKKKNASGEFAYDLNEKFDIVPNGQGGVKVTQGNGKLYEAFINEDGNKENQFTNYYQLLICFPTPNEFNNMTWEEIDDVKKDPDNILFQLIARDNRDQLFKYTYYQINSGVQVMIEACTGKVINGVETWDEPKYNFNTSINDIEVLRENFITLINGGDVRPEDYIY